MSTSLDYSTNEKEFCKLELNWIQWKCCWKIKISYTMHSLCCFFVSLVYHSLLLVCLFKKLFCTWLSFLIVYHSPIVFGSFTLDVLANSTQVFHQSTISPWGHKQ